MANGKVETTSSNSKRVQARVEESSSSWCVQPVHLHSFEVPSFSLLRGMGVARFVDSRIFSAGGRDWNIRVYPNGCNEDNAEYVSVFMSLVGVPNPEDTKTRTKYTLELLEKDGKVSQLTSYTPMLSHTFEELDSYWGFVYFVERSKLEPLLRLNDDCFTVRCTLTVIGESQSEDVAAAAIIMAKCPQPNMHQHFEHMLNTGKGKDVTFDVGGQLFHAHRCVLAARSPVFEALVFGPMKEKAMAEPIKVADMEPSVFEELLRFIYTDSLLSTDSKNDDDDDEEEEEEEDDEAEDKTPSMQQHLLVAADRYGLDRLRLMCEVSLCHGIDEQTVATTLALAEQHQFAHLKDACLEFIASQDELGVVLKTEGFKHLVASYPLIAVEILEKIAEA